MGDFYNGINSFRTRGRESTRDTLRNTNVFLVPSTFFDRFTKKYSADQLNDYSKVRELGSLQDIAFNIATATKVNDFFQQWLVSSNSFGSYFVDSFRPGMTDVQEREYETIQQIVVPDNDTQDAVDYFLDPTAFKDKHGIVDSKDQCYITEITESSFLENKEKVPYRVVTYQNSIYIVVEEGFLEYVKGTEPKKVFIATVLKAAYEVMPIESVNTSEWYSLYLETLKG